jgi:hypothetical protein
MTGKGCAAIVFLILSACSTTEQAGTALRSKWVGRSSDEFFTRYGPPASEFKLASGDTIYTWTGGQASIGVPAVASTSFEPGGATTIVSGGGSINMSCTVQITASGPARTIQAIGPFRDTIGMWQMSRCAEMFVS